MLSQFTQHLVDMDIFGKVNQNHILKPLDTILWPTHTSKINFNTGLSTPWSYKWFLPNICNSLIIFSSHNCSTSVETTVTTHPLDVSHLKCRFNHSGKQHLLGAQLHHQGLQVWEVLIIWKLAHCQPPLSGVHKANAHHLHKVRWNTASNQKLNNTKILDKLINKGIKHCMHVLWVSQERSSK